MRIIPSNFGLKNSDNEPIADKMFFMSSLVKYILTHLKFDTTIFFKVQGLQQGQYLTLAVTAASSLGNCCW